MSLLDCNEGRRNDRVGRDDTRARVLLSQVIKFDCDDDHTSNQFCSRGVLQMPVTATISNEYFDCDNAHGQAV